MSDDAIKVWWISAELNSCMEREGGGNHRKQPNCSAQFVPNSSRNLTVLSHQHNREPSVSLMRGDCISVVGAQLMSWVEDRNTLAHSSMDLSPSLFSLCCFDWWMHLDLRIILDKITVNYCDNQFIWVFFSSNICWYQLLKCENMLGFFLSFMTVNDEYLGLELLVG